MTGRLILPSAWDVGSAKIYESAGFAAVGTTSAGIAASRGYSDGEDVPFPAAAETAEGMAASLSIPLTADIEYGYARDREALLANIDRLVSAGVVGINIEDGFEYDGAPEDRAFPMTERIQAVKERGEATGQPLFVNARVDIYWLQAYEEEADRRTEPDRSRFAGRLLWSVAGRFHSLFGHVRPSGAGLPFRKLTRCPSAL